MHNYGIWHSCPEATNKRSWVATPAHELKMAWSMWYSIPVHPAVSVADCNTQLPALPASSLGFFGTRKIERMVPHEMQYQNAIFRTITTPIIWPSHHWQQLIRDRFFVM